MSCTEYLIETVSGGDGSASLERLYGMAAAQERRDILEQDGHHVVVYLGNQPVYESSPAITGSFYTELESEDAHDADRLDPLRDGQRNYLSSNGRGSVEQFIEITTSAWKEYCGIGRWD